MRTGITYNRGQVCFDYKLHVSLTNPPTNQPSPTHLSCPPTQVRENLEFAAALRLPKDTLLSQRAEVVRAVTQILGLSHVQFIIVGSPEARGGPETRILIVTCDQVICLPEASVHLMP